MKILMVHGLNCQENSQFGLNGEPEILMACRAEELTHEYRHASGHSYGTFTHAISQVLRDSNRKPIKTTKQLSELIRTTRRIT